MVLPVEPYLKENVDEYTTVTPWNEKKSFPLFLQTRYHFYHMTILGTKCLLIEPVGEMAGIDQLKKHIRLVQNHTERHIVFFYKRISRYRRKSLMENRIAFLVEDGQMYLPFLGLDLKKAPEHVERDGKRFTTPAQIAYSYFLYHTDDVMNVTGFADTLGWNTMTASRALNDLYHADLITYEMGGKTRRSKQYRRIPDPDYFLKGRESLKTPVRNTVYTRTAPSGALTAGLEALAAVSLISPPGHPVWAIEKKRLREEAIEIVTNRDLIRDQPLAELQLWDYDPALFSRKSHVDLLSLYASLKEIADERIEKALEEALRGESWYTA